MTYQRKVNPGDPVPQSIPSRADDRLREDIETAIARYVGVDDGRPLPLCVAPRWAEAADAIFVALTTQAPTGPDFQVIARLTAAIAGVMEL